MSAPATSGRLRGALVLAALTVAAAIVVDGGLVEHRAIAGPVAILRAVAAALRDGSLATDLLATVRRTALGVALGAVLGVLVAMPTSRSRDGIDGPLDFLRAIPPLLVLPLFCFALGYGEAARVLVVAWAAALALSLHVGAALARPPGERERVLASMGASTWQRFRFVRSRELVPPFVVGVRHAVATGLVVSVVTEMVIADGAGLGARAVAAQIAYDTAGLWAVLFVTGLLGWGAGRVLLGFERRIAHWRAA